MSNLPTNMLMFLYEIKVVIYAVTQKVLQQLFLLCQIYMRVIKLYDDALNALNLK